MREKLLLAEKTAQVGKKLRGGKENKRWRDYPTMTCLICVYEKGNIES